MKTLKMEKGIHGMRLIIVVLSLSLLVLTSLSSILQAQSTRRIAKSNKPSDLDEHQDQPPVEIPKALVPPPQERGNDETPQVQKLRIALQEKHSELPSVEVNTQQENVSFKTVDLSSTMTEVEGKRYYAFRFTTPETPGHLFWSFKMPRQAFGWYIVPANGRMYGFTNFDQRALPRDVTNVGKTGDRFVLQSLPSGNLKPSKDYIMWFGVNEGGDTTVTLSLNVFPSEQRYNLSSIFPFFFNRRVITEGAVHSE